MKNFLLLTFIFTSLIIYYIINPYVIFSLTFILIIINYILKIKFKGLKAILLFIILTIIFNLFFNSFIFSLLLGARLLIIYLLTLIISHFLSCLDIAKGISSIFFFKKNKRDLEITIALSISLIPIMIDEISNFKKVLISKNFPLNFKNIYKKPNVFFQTFLSNSFKRIQEMEIILKAKGYE